MILQILGVIGMLMYLISIVIELFVGTDRPRPYFGLGLLTVIIWWQVNITTATFISLIFTFYTCIVLYFYYDNFIKKS